MRPQRTWNVHLYPTPFTNDSRVLKSTRSLAASGLFERMVVLARARQGLPAHEEIDSQRSVIRLAAGSPGSTLLHKAVYVLRWNVLAWLELSRMPVRCVSAHSLSVLPVSVLYRLRHPSTALVYEPHELETETVGSRGLGRLLRRVAERALINRVDGIITVNRSIADWYAGRYGCEPVVVRNMPSADLQPSGSEPEWRRALPDDAMVFLYQGQLGAHRGIDRLLDVFRVRSDDKHLVVLGDGPLEPLVLRAAKASSHITHVPMVPPHEVLTHTAAADVGLMINDGTALSYYLALPNKLFEYIAAGIPFIASDFPEYRMLLEQGAVGWLIEPDVEALRALVDGLLRDEVTEQGQRADVLRDRFRWELDEPGMVRVYEEATARSSGRGRPRFSLFRRAMM